MQYKHFSIEEREEIQLGLWRKESVRSIARRLGRSHTSLVREIGRNKPMLFHRYTPRLANERALAPQVWAVFTAPSVTGVSIPMFALFALIQSAATLEGIRVRSAPMFYSMLVSVCMSTTIIIVVLVRG